MNRLTIRTKARRKLDETSPKFWTDDDLNDYLDEGIKHYWQWMIDAVHPATLKETSSLTVTANSPAVPLPADYYKTKMLERILTDGTTDPLDFFERSEDTNPPSSSTGDDYRPTYRFVGDDIILEGPPIFSSTSFLKLTYMFIPDDMTDDTSTPPSILGTMFPNMLIQYIVVAAKEKEESLDPGGADLGPIKRKLMEMEEKFKSTIETETLQRQYVEPFSTDDGE